MWLGFFKERLVSLIFLGIKVNFINDLLFIFCSYWIFWFTREFTQSLFIVESRSYFMRSEYTRSFSVVPSTYGKFIHILISSSWISVVCVSCCDWSKLWLLVFLLKILIIMLSWYSFAFNTCFILAFSLCKSSLFVVMEYALLNKEETTLSLQLVWWWELYCRYWSVCVGFL